MAFNELLKKWTLLTCAVGATTVAQAIVVFDYEVVVTGSTPGGAPPWATLLIQNDGPNKVDMTLTHNPSSEEGQFISRLYLNIDPFPNNLQIIENSPKIIDADFGLDNFTDAGGKFDARIKFETSNANNGANRLKPGESVSWEITGTGITEQSFQALSTGSLNVLSLIHMQGITDKDSGKIAPVPEPATMFGLLAALGLLRARRK